MIIQTIILRTAMYDYFKSNYEPFQVIKDFRDDSLLLSKEASENS